MWEGAWSSMPSGCAILPTSPRVPQPGSSTNPLLLGLHSMGMIDYILLGAS